MDKLFSSATSSLVRLVSINGSDDDLASVEEQPRLNFFDRLQSALNTWRGITLAGISVALFVLITNLTLLFYAVAQSPAVKSNGLVTISDGDCDANARISVVVHLAINILSNLLLGASNHCMQALSSPTREEVDNAHSRGQWLSIGTFSMRNLSFVSHKRRYICAVLGLSSLPLSLLYNSVIIQKLSANNFSAVVVTEDVLTSGVRVYNDTSVTYVDPKTWVPTCNSSWVYSYSGSNGYGFDPAGNDSTNNYYYCANIPDNPTPLHNDYMTAYQTYWSIQPFSNGEGDFVDLTYLSASDCIKAYNKDFVSAWSNTLLVTNQTNTTQNILSFSSLTDSIVNVDTRGPIPWLCGPTLNCDIRSAQSTGVWMFGGITVNLYETIQIDHCMAQSVKPHCELAVSMPILAIVIVCNIAKAICFLWAMLTLEFQPLVTVGDALDSFLTRPDHTTLHQSSTSVRDVRKECWAPMDDTAAPSNVEGRLWLSKKHHWASASGARRWTVTLLVCFLIWTIAAALLGVAATAQNIDFSPSAFGQVTTDTLFGGPGAPASQNAALITNAIVANLPQIAISFAYVFYNGLFTAMTLVDEYSTYVKHRKGLRTSVPRGQQRGSYFLSLPFRYSVPLMAVMMLLHWLASQAIFSVNVAVYNQYSEAVPDQDINTWGWSGSAIVASVIVGAVIILVLPIMGLRRYPAGVILAANCSVALSAACHPFRSDDNKQDDIGARRVKYGVLVEKTKTGENDRQIKRLGFSSEAVDPLVEGEFYEAPRNARKDGPYNGRQTDWIDEHGKRLITQV